MAFDRKKLALASAHANADAGNIWSYKSTDTFATITTGTGTTSYWVSAADELQAGDLIIVSGIASGTPHAELFFVSAVVVSPRSVTISALDVNAA